MKSDWWQLWYKHNCHWEFLKFKWFYKNFDPCISESFGLVNISHTTHLPNYKGWRFSLGVQTSLFYNPLAFLFPLLPIMLMGNNFSRAIFRRNSLWKLCTPTIVSEKCENKSNAHQSFKHKEEWTLKNGWNCLKTRHFSISLNFYCSYFNLLYIQKSPDNFYNWYDYLPMTSLI